MMEVSLRQVEILITSFCNLHCKHCYQHFDKNKYKLPFEYILRILQYALQQGAKRFVLSGGEVFTYPKFLGILDYLASASPSSYIRVVTNATLVTDTILKKIPQGKITFQVSVDGDPEHHDMRRGKGSYKRVINAVRQIKKHGFRVAVNITVDGINLPSISSLLRHISDMVDEITITPVANTGAARLNYRSLRLDDSILNEILPMVIRKISKPWSKRCVLFPYGFSVNYDGTVYPCSLARDYKMFPMGNVFEQDIKDIIQGYLQSAESTLFLNYKSNEEIFECKICPARNLCHTGCRIRAYKWYQQLLAPDPFACRVYINKHANVNLAQLYWGDFKCDY